MWNMPGVMTAIACGRLDDGTVARLESEKRRDATARQAIVTAALKGLQCVRHPASYFVWLPPSKRGSCRPGTARLTLVAENIG